MTVVKPISNITILIRPSRGESLSNFIALTSAIISCGIGLTGSDITSFTGTEDIWAFISLLCCFGISVIRKADVILRHWPWDDAICVCTLQVFTEAPTVDSWLGWKGKFKRVFTELVFPAPSAPNVAILNWFEDWDPSFRASWYAMTSFISTKSGFFPSVSSTYSNPMMKM